MAGIILEFTFLDGGLIVLEGKNVKFWKGMGLPDFEGDFEGFAIVYPEKTLELLRAKVIIRQYPTYL